MFIGQINKFIFIDWKIDLKNNSKKSKIVNLIS